MKRILRLARLRLRGPSGAQFEFTLAAIAQNLRRLGKLIARPPGRIKVGRQSATAASASDFCNNIGQELPIRDVRYHGKY